MNVPLAKHWKDCRLSFDSLQLFTLFFVCFMLCRYIASKNNMHISRSCKSSKVILWSHVEVLIFLIKTRLHGSVRSSLSIKLLHFLLWLVSTHQVFSFSASWATFAWSVKCLNVKEHSLVYVSISIAVKINHLCWTKKVIMSFNFLLSLLFCWFSKSKYFSQLNKPCIRT